MSLRAQIAFGRNNTLQKQFEDQCLNIRQRFKYSRRRQDTFEEECVDSLYKLLLFAKDNNGDSSPKGNNSGIAENQIRTSSALIPRRSQSVFGIRNAKKDDTEPIKRPATAMSATTYTQSYSFKIDGMNIDKNRRDRYLRNKQQKENEKKMQEEAIRFESIRKETPDLEKKLLQDSLSTKKEDSKRLLDVRPKTAGHESLSTGRKNSALLKRPSTRLSTQNTSLSVDFMPSPPVNREDTPERTATPKNGSRRPSKQTTFSRQTVTPPLNVYQENVPDTGKKEIPKSFKATTKSHNHNTGDESHAPNVSPRVDSRLDDPTEEYDIPLSDKDKKKLEELTANERSTSLSRPQTRPSTCLSRKDLAEDALKESIEKTQTFLRQYSRRSKLFGFVLKTRSAKIAREKVRAHRSPCITYQELVTIKANIKQHVSKTRSLLQRSAKLSSYVDKLATANVQRQFLKERKAASAAVTRQ